ncbi:MAG: hypothetical protein QOJ57_1635 [Thermoleophilaceae bacterium]|jgi:hypothetical protein|nr:hypothetical protein [Thermoleophilaceae bacterium]
MSVNEVVIEASPSEVFEVLSTAELYAHWVVGAHESQETDPRWPQPGSVFHHKQGFPPLTITDTTSVVSVDPPRRFVLEARVRPLVVALVDISLEEHPSGCLVRMEERVVGGLMRYMPRSLVERLLHRRNDESLSRLREIALRRRTPRQAS